MTSNLKTYKKISLDAYILCLWWLNILIQSFIEMGIIYQATFFITTILFIYLNKSNAIVLLLLSFYVPYTNSIPAPFALITFISFVIYLLKSRLDIKFFLSSRYIFTYVFFIFSIFYSIIFFDVGIATPKIINYLITLFSFCVFLLLFNQIESLSELHGAVKMVLIFSSLSFFISLGHYLEGNTTNLYLEILNNSNSEELINKLYTDVFSSVRRLVWPGVEPNFYSSAFIFSLSISLYFAKQNSKYYFVSFLILLSIAGTFSRTAFILGLLVVFISSISNKNKTVMFFGCSLLFMILVSFNLDYISRISSIIDNIVESGGTGRLTLLQQAIEIFANNPFGMGIGNLNNVDYNSHYITSGFSTHNSFLEILVESGIVGFLLFLLSIYFLLFNKKTLSFDNSQFKNSAFLGVVVTLIFYTSIPQSDFRFLYLICLIYTYHLRLSKDIMINT
jgi:hypothetical protein